MPNAPIIPFRVPGAELCAVVGFPVSHSRSPYIHRAFAEQCGMALQYERVEVQPGQLAATLHALHDLGCKGVNVTVPLKEEAAALAIHPAEAVQLTGAANTLWWNKEGALHADNTDGVGLVRDLAHNWGLALAGCRLALLGAGGAAAGVIPPLLKAGVAEILIVNRNPSRADALMQRFKGLGDIRTAEPAARDLPPVDLIINATSAGLSAQAPVFPASLLTPRTRCYDMFYASALTPFLLACEATAGCSHLRDGLGMLVEQAAEAFARWHGQRPVTEAILAALRSR